MVFIVYFHCFLGALSQYYLHALMATLEVKSSSKVLKIWTTANLLPEALAVDLHVLEDEIMIRSLGRDKFVQLSINGSQGWQHGVSAPSQYILVSLLSPHVCIFVFFVW